MQFIFYFICSEALINAKSVPASARTTDTAPRQGFVLIRHWRDTPRGTEVDLWLATDDGPQKVRLPLQESVAFIPAEQRTDAD